MTKDMQTEHELTGSVYTSFSIMLKANSLNDEDPGDLRISVLKSLV